MIRNRHLKQLVQTAATLGGQKLETALWRRLEDLGAALPPKGESDRDPTGARAATARADIARLRALVADSLQTLATRVDQTLPPALAGARQAWEKVDSHVLVDAPLDASLGVARRTLELALGRPDPIATVALEGITALALARGLVALAEQRMSSLIRLRLAQSGSDEAAESDAPSVDPLLPAGRPFLDLAAAIAEAGRAWT